MAQAIYKQKIVNNVSQARYTNTVIDNVNIFKDRTNNPHVQNTWDIIIKTNRRDMFLNNCIRKHKIITQMLLHYEFSLE